MEEWPIEQRAAYFARRGMVELGQSDHPKMVDFIGKINAIWEKWNAMSGDNHPLMRCKACPRHDFDINIDGMAHYGMLPDFLQDLRNIGLTAEDLAPLFRSAFAYIQMWETCEHEAVRVIGNFRGIDTTANSNEPVVRVTDEDGAVNKAG